MSQDVREAVTGRDEAVRPDRSTRGPGEDRPTGRQPPRPDETVAVHILLPWGMGECTLKARAVWVQTDDSSRAIGAGLSFEEVSDDARRKLMSYLARFAELEGEITR